MQLSRYFYHIFLAYVWLSVEVPHLCRSAVVASDKKQDSEQYWTALNQCLQKCSGDIKARISMINNTEGQPCYHECRRKIGSLHLTRNQQVKSVPKRTKRDQDIWANVMQPGDIKGKNCSDSLHTKDAVDSASIHFKFLPCRHGSKTSNAIVSWTPQPEITRNWTGYKVVYYFGDIGKEEMSPYFCRDIVGKNITFTYVTIPNEGRQPTSQIRVAVIFLPHTHWGSKAKDGFTYLKAVNCTQESQNTKTARTPSDSLSKQAAAAIGAVCFCFLLLVAVVCRLRFKRQKRETSFAPLDPDFKFDAFIIYSTVDQKWVTKKLLPTLESKHNMKCCIHYRDFVPGVPFTRNMADSVYNSKKTVAVVSKSFLNSNFCSHELSIALHRLAERGDDSVVVIKLDDVENSQLPKELRFRSYIDFTKSTDRKTWEYKLVTLFKA
ncbi:uncharacterized protein [Montipora capricornis]|uniref:uncharacterized protein isoform X5 n=1 Tax=Montipora capricornis TaxID=246305 RepID=UPI0035F16AE4